MDDYYDWLDVEHENNDVIDYCSVCGSRIEYDFELQTYFCPLCG